MGRGIWISSSVLALIWCGAAQAQQAVPEPDTSTALEEVVVTAERRTSNLQQTPIAAAVFSGEQLQNKGVTNIESLQFAAPSVTIQNSGMGNSFNIRGIGKTENSSSIGVGVITYRDGVAVFPAYLQNEPLYDIASLELLRGPQGTFAGQNATGGAVFITEKNPDFSGVGGYFTGQFGNYEHVRLQGALNLPIADTLAVRLAFNTDQRDSFYNVVEGAPTEGDPGAVDSQSYRISVLWEPTDALRVLFKTDYSTLDLGGYTADAGQKLRMRGGILLPALIATAVSIPASLYPIMPTVGGFALVLFVLLVGGTIVNLVNAAAIAVLIPNEERATSLAALKIIGTLVAGLVVPPVIAGMTTLLPGPSGLGQALAWLGGVTGVISLIGYWLAMVNAPESVASEPVAFGPAA